MKRENKSGEKKWIAMKMKKVSTVSRCPQCPRFTHHTAFFGEGGVLAVQLPAAQLFDVVEPVFRGKDLFVVGLGQESG